MSALYTVLNWVDKHEPQLPWAQARAEYASLLARIKELKEKCADQRRLICASQGWNYQESDDTPLVSKTVNDLAERLKKYEADNESMRKVVEAAQMWRWSQGEGILPSADSIIALNHAVEEFELSQ